MSTRQSFQEFPKRGKLAILVISIVFSVSVYSFMVFEKLSFLDSIYFLIVTVSTVGFGDIQPQHEFTKIVLILLIITGISTLALLSEIAIDKIVLLRSAGVYDLPASSIDLDNHVVFTQFNDVVERMALYIQDRFFDVVIIDRDEDTVKAARRKGFRSYIGEAEEPQTLELLSLDRACALYLFFDNDNYIIQASILAESLAPRLLIYASTNEHLSIDYGNIVGITRTYHNERLLGSFISNNVRPFDSFILPNQDVDDNYFMIALIKNSEKNKDMLNKGICIGAIDSNFMDITMFSDQEEVWNSPEGKRVLIVYPKHEDLSSLKVETSDRPHEYNKILIAGWSKNINHLIEHLDIDHERIQYLTFDESSYEMAQANGYDILYIAIKKMFLIQLMKI